MRRSLVAISVAVAGLVLPGLAKADVVDPRCNGAPCSSGWYRVNVSVTFTINGGTIVSGCQPVQVTSDTDSFSASCVVDTGGGHLAGVNVPIKRDATPPTAAAGASRGPDTNGWYNHALDVSFSGSDNLSGIASCTSTTYSGPDNGSAGVSGTCTDNAGNVSAPSSLGFKYDGTAPSVSGNPDRAPDANGWYNHAVSVGFAGTDATSGIDSCSPATTYSGPDDGSASVSGSCRDAAGNSATGTFGLKFDSTPPKVAANPARGADANGWYNHAVAVTFAGTDATSGIDSCSSSTYSGPDDGTAAVSGSCKDNAGNSAGGSFGFKYDSTPPTLTDLVATALDGSVTLKWKLSKDATKVTVTRAAGKSNKGVYDGKGTEALTDKNLANGVRYSYVVKAVDEAGNVVSKEIKAEPSAPLFAPRQETRVHGSVLLRWRPVAKASYYNVQLWYARVKILSKWPTGPSFRVPRHWTFGGHSYSLKPGRYTWYVWPGFGKRAKHKFGARVGTSAFVVAR